MHFVGLFFSSMATLHYPQHLAVSGREHEWRRQAYLPWIPLVLESVVCVQPCCAHDACVLTVETVTLCHTLWRPQENGSCVAPAMMEGAHVESANTPIPTVKQPVSWVFDVAPHPFSGFKWINGVSLSSVRVGISRLFECGANHVLCSHSYTRRDVRRKEAVIDQVMGSDRNCSFTWQPHDLSQALWKRCSYQFLVWKYMLRTIVNDVLRCLRCSSAYCALICG